MGISFCVYDSAVFSELQVQRAAQFLHSIRPRHPPLFETTRYRPALLRNGLGAIAGPGLA
jgi:hypothetical protein